MSDLRLWSAAGAGLGGLAFLLYVVAAETCGFGRRPAAWNAGCDAGPERGPARVASDLAFILAGSSALLFVEASGMAGASWAVPLAVLTMLLRPGGRGRLDRLSVHAYAAFVVLREAAGGEPPAVFWSLFAVSTAALEALKPRRGALAWAVAAALAAGAWARGDVLWLLAAATTCGAGALLRRGAERHALCPAHREEHRVAADVLTAVAALCVFLHLR